MNRRFLSFAGIASAFLWASTANAATITIGLQEAGFNGGAIQTVASSATGVAQFAGAFGTFTSITASGTGNPPLPDGQLLNSNTLDVSGATPGTLNVYVTSSGNTSPTGLIPFLSSFTNNLLTAGWTVTERTFLDAGNGVFATTTALGSAVFDAIGTSVTTTLAATGAGPYSLTHLYTIVATGIGSANSTINLSAVPLPGALPLFATGLLGLWALRRKRKAKAEESLPALAA
jgi:hypothetical protein